MDKKLKEDAGIPLEVKKRLLAKLEAGPWGGSVRNFCLSTGLEKDPTIESVSRRIISPSRISPKGVTAGYLAIVCFKLGFERKEIVEILREVISKRPETRQKELLRILEQ